jgi:hypothetical protein
MRLFCLYRFLLWPTLYETQGAIITRVSLVSVENQFQIYTNMTFRARHQCNIMIPKRLGRQTWWFQTKAQRVEIECCT